jgi:WD40 repeat protein
MKCHLGPAIGLAAALAIVLTLSAAPAPDAPPDAGLPAGAVARLGEKHFRFDLPYDDFLLTPDGKLIVALNRNKVALGELASGKEVASWPNSPHQLRFAGITADGKEVATWSHDKAEVVFLDLSGRRKAESATFPVEPFRHVKHVALSSDGKRLAFVVEVYGDRRAWHRVAVMEREGRKALFQKEHTAISSAAFSADGKTVAVASEQYEPAQKERIVAITLYDIAKGQPLRELGRARELQRRTYRLLAFSADDKRLISYDPHHPKMSFWDTESGKEIVPDEKRGLKELATDFPLPVRFVAWAAEALRQGRGDEYKIQVKDEHYWPVAITPDQRTLILDLTNRGAFSFKLVDIATRKELPLTTAPAGFDEVHYLSDGDTLLARRSGTWQLWDLRARKVIPAVDGQSAEEVARQAVRPQPAWFDAQRHESGFPAAPLEQTGFKKINFDRWEKVEEAGRSPDGKIVVQKQTAWSNFSGAVPKKSVQFSFHEAAGGKPLPHGEIVNKIHGAFRFSPDSRILVVAEHHGRQGHRLLFFDMTGQAVATAQGRVGPVFSPSGKQAVVADEEKGITLVDLMTRKLQVIDQEGVAALAFSPRGDRLAGANRDGTIMIWDLLALPKKE